MGQRDHDEAGDALSPESPGRRRLLVALVLSGRVATEIDGLRRALGSSDLFRIAPHITLVPPKNVSGDELTAVFDHLRTVGRGYAPLRLALGPVATFPPEQRVVYLAVADADEGGSLGRLAAALSSGPLAPPPTRARRGYVPHITVTNRATPELARAALTAFATYGEEVTLDAFTVLECDLGSPGHPWRPLSVVPLAPSKITGRGGFEVVIEETLPSDIEIQQFVRDELATDAGALGQPLPVHVALVARVDGRLAGIVSASMSGAVCDIALHLVARRERGAGIGTRLLNELEAHAARHGCDVLRCLVGSDLPAVAYYLGRGFREWAIIPGVDNGATLVVLVRELALALRREPES